MLLLFGLAIVQFGLIYQAQTAVEHAALQAARHASVAHADMQVAKRGLAQGLAPWWRGASDMAALQIAEREILAHLEAGLAQGWVEFDRRSPSEASFGDWAVPALDSFGDPIDGVLEIPNDNLDSRRVRMQPAAGSAGSRQGEPIGSASGQTLADANQLRVEFVYGMRLVVPVAGKAIVGALRAAQGCADTQPAGGTAGGTAGGVAPAASAAARGICDYLMADPPRLPLRTAASVRMMSTGRRDGSGTSSGAAAAGSAPGRRSADSVSAGTGESAGSTGSAGSGSSISTPATQGANQTLLNGFLGIGSDRAYPDPHPALCTG